MEPSRETQLDLFYDFIPARLREIGFDPCAALDDIRRALDIRHDDLRQLLRLRISIQRAWNE
jgi:hypothetical protein